jgi:nucleotide-binding universal stress UspA family protein
VSRIVVGVDGSEESRRALLWAVEEARLRGAVLEVLHAWEPQPLPTASPGLAAGLSPMPVDAGDYVETMDALREGAEALVRTLRAELGDAARGVDLRTTVVEGPPAGSLLDASTGADLVVVGSRGHGSLVELVLGSVSRDIVHRARCPVVVVPAQRADETARSAFS